MRGTWSAAGKVNRRPPRADTSSMLGQAGLDEERASGDEGAFAAIPGRYAVKRRLIDVVINPMRAAWAGIEGVVPPSGLLLHGPPGHEFPALVAALAESLDVPHMALDVEELMDDGGAVAPGELAGAVVRRAGAGRRVVELTGVERLADVDLSLGPTAGRPPQWLAAGIEELQRVEPTERGLVVVTTHLPWTVSRWMLRPGVVDRAAFVAPPDWDARHRVLLEALAAGGCDHPAGIERIVAATEGWSTADLTGFVGSAAVDAPDCRSRVEALAAAATLAPGTATVWLATARELTGLQGGDLGMFDDLLGYLRRVRLA